jgi:flagellar biogenesis protein FliO
LPPAGSATSTGNVVPLSSSLPLAPRRGDARKSAPRASAAPAIYSALTSLAVVLGLFLAIVWLLRRAQPRAATVLPREVFDVLGRAALGPRRQAQLVRCGRKLLLLCTTEAGVETLTEITDPVEVDHLAGLCMQAQPHSASSWPWR